MKAYMNYHVVSSKTLAELQEQVENELVDGYAPLGGLIYTEQDGYCQALVMEIEDHEDTPEADLNHLAVVNSEGFKKAVKSLYNPHNKN